MLSLYGFLNPFGVLSPQIIKFTIYLLVVFGLIIAYNAANKKGLKINYPRKTYWTLMSGILVSIFMASAFHTQSLSISFMTTLSYIIGYGTLFLFLKLDISERDVINVFFWLSVIAIPVYFVNAATYPNMIFGGAVDKGEDLTRGILRIPMYYLDLMVFFLFYGINQWLEKRSKKWIIWALVCMIMIFLSVTRQCILFSAVLGLIFLLKKSSWIKRILIIAATATFIFVVLPAIPAYQAMVELSEDQRDSNSEEDDIRIQAYEFYLNSYQTNELTRIFGNGLPAMGNSPWGNMVESELDDTGCLYADIGWGGFYWLFGIFSVVALFLLCLFAITRRKSPSNKFLSYWIAYFILYCIAAGPNIYIEQIVIYMVGLYLCFRPQSDNKNPEDESNGSNNPKLQQRRGLYQLREEC